MCNSYDNVLVTSYINNYSLPRYNTNLQVIKFYIIKGSKWIIVQKK